MRNGRSGASINIAGDKLNIVGDKHSRMCDFIYAEQLIIEDWEYVKRATLSIAGILGKAQI